MNKFIRPRNLLILGIILVTAPGFTQDNNRSSMIYGSGFGITSLDEKIAGMGPDIFIGMSYNSKIERLKITPGLKLGSYWSGEAVPKRDEYFNTFHANLLLDYTLLKLHSFSFSLNTGGLVGVSRGLRGTGTEFDSATSSDIVHSSSRFINEFSYGFKIGGEISYTPKESRFSYCFLPISLAIGNNGLRILETGFRLKINYLSNND
jgi:hypothetical protein